MLALHLLPNSLRFGSNNFTALGMPVSTTQAIVGGILGVGLTKGIKTVRWKVLKNIIFGGL